MHDDIVYARKLMNEVELALKVMARIIDKEGLSLEDEYALPHAIIEAVGSLALIAQRLARVKGYSIARYSDAMKFYYKAGIVDEYTVNELTKSAKLRNLIVHRYWEVDDNKILE